MTQVASGQGHGLALLADGSVRGWGGWNDNQAGEASVPVGLGGVTRICAGVGSHSVALRFDGTVVCWGSNGYGECLGTSVTGQAIVGTPDGRPVMVMGVTLTEVRDVAAGFYHTVALRHDGTVVTWGEDAGQRSLPAGLVGVRAIGAGMWATYVLRNDGTVTGAACDGFEPLVTAPSRSNLFTAVASGWDHALAIRTDRSLVAWGDNGNFQCSIPTNVTNVLQAAGGFQHSIALLSTGRVRCWGSNLAFGGRYAGQGTDLSSLTSVTQIACGDFHNVARRSTGSVVCWGLNDQGRCLGSSATGTPIGGTPTGQATRVRGVTLASIAKVAAGGDHSMAVNAAGAVFCWGSNVDSEGNAVGQSTPPASLSGVVGIAGSGNHSLALRSDGTVVGWGSNDWGESRGTDALGQPIGGAPDGQPIRIDGQLLAGISQISATGEASLALRPDGTVVAWGAAPAPAPQALVGVQSIVGGRSHALVLLDVASSDCAGVGAAGRASLR
ncbi:MAG: hypothetical protein EBQ99_10695, partial [Planctomycetes bacterium]|nr:hypothetical protein [Planctomycetota bacterium]